MTKNIKLSIPDGCGNAPRKLILKDVNLAFVTNDEAFLEENMSDKITWEIIGEATIEGKEPILNRPAEYHKGEITELILHDIITHGRVASVHGKVIGTEVNYDFCHVYNFTGASKTAKIKEITSYIIPK